MKAHTKAIRNIGLAGLAAIFIINLASRLLFKHIFPQFLAEDWWFEWFPIYVGWLALIGGLIWICDRKNLQRSVTDNH